MIAGNEAVMQQVRANARGAKGWLKFLGILSIIGGALYALTIVGIIIAWMPIWIGVVMNQAGGRAAQFAERGDPQALAEYTAKLKTLFSIMGIVTIISMALSIIGAIILLAVGVFSGAMLPNLLEQMGYGN